MLRLVVLTPLVAALGVLVMMPAPAPGKPAPAPAAAPRPDEELVNRVGDSIKRGVGYLKSKQNKGTGNWEGVVLGILAEMEGGATALVTLALLNSGEKPDDPQVAAALKYLRALPPKKTYVVGLQNMVFAETRSKGDLPLIQRNADWLVEKAIGLPAGRLEGWSYPGNSVADNSNTQYALLGLYAAKQAGAKIDDGVWRAIQEFYTRTQQKPNAKTPYWYWTYQATQFDREASFTMTVAGVCGLLIAGMGLDQSTQRLDPATGVAAACGTYAENAPVARGLNSIAAQFSFEQGKSVFYNVYGLERLGRLSGQRFVGRYDWYREGCEYLLRAQTDTGAFFRKGSIDSAEVVSTSFALLFLSKGRTPVLVSKYAWGEYRDAGGGTFEERTVGAAGEVNWNRKHNDTRHLVEFAGRELFKGAPLAWQVYDPRRQNFDTEEKRLAEVGVLLQSPVLYLNGHGRMPFVGLPGERLGNEELLLQKYVDEGGFILAEACCGDAEFAASFRLLMKRLFPSNDLRRLPDSHAVWSAYFTDPGLAAFAGLEGLEKGCRTVVVFSPKPLAGYWEEHRYMPAPGRAPAKAGDPTYRGELAYKLAGNVIAYATGLELPKPRLTRQVLIDPNAAEKGVARGVFKVAQLNTSNDPEPAPAAVRNLMGHVRDRTRVDVSLSKVLLPPGSPDLRFYLFMYLHGRKPLALGEAEIEGIKTNLQGGGLLFADAGCNGFDSWKKFDASFRETCKKLYPDSELQVIPADDPLYSAKQNGGQAVASVRARRETADGKGPEAEMRTYAPYLEGVKIDGRWVVVYSKYDVGCALEGHKASDCMGHDKDSALRLASAVVLYALKR